MLTRSWNNTYRFIWTISRTIGWPYSQWLNLPTTMPWMQQQEYPHSSQTKVTTWSSHQTHRPKHHCWSTGILSEYDLVYWTPCFSKHLWSPSVYSDALHSRLCRLHNNHTTACAMPCCLFICLPLSSAHVLPSLFVYFPFLLFPILTGSEPMLSLTAHVV